MTKQDRSEEIPEDVYPHGAVKPLTTSDNGKWIYFSSTAAGGEEYPVIFTIDQIPDLISWLQFHLRRANNPNT